MTFLDFFSGIGGFRKNARCIKARYDNGVSNIACDKTGVLCISDDCPDKQNEVLPITTHLNTKCLHCHFVINSVSFFDGKMLHGKEKAWFYFHHIADEICREHNLFVIDNPERNPSPKFLTIQDSEGRPTRYNLTRDAIDEAIAHSCNMREFEMYLKQMGYRYKLSQNLKYWTVIPKG